MFGNGSGLGGVGLLVGVIRSVYVGVGWYKGSMSIDGLCRD